MLTRSSSAIQLLGIDLMVSKDWHIWFIESNNYPLWAQGGWMTQFTATMGVGHAHDTCITNWHGY